MALSMGCLASHGITYGTARRLRHWRCTTDGTAHGTYHETITHPMGHPTALLTGRIEADKGAHGPAHGAFSIAWDNPWYRPCYCSREDRAVYGKPYVTTHGSFDSHGAAHETSRWSAYGTGRQPMTQPMTQAMIRLACYGTSHGLYHTTNYSAVTSYGAAHRIAQDLLRIPWGSPSSVP